MVICSNDYYTEIEGDLCEDIESRCFVVLTLRLFGGQNLKQMFDLEVIRTKFFSQIPKKIVWIVFTFPKTSSHTRADALLKKDYGEWGDKII